MLERKSNPSQWTKWWLGIESKPSGQGANSNDHVQPEVVTNKEDKKKDTNSLREEEQSARARASTSTRAADEKKEEEEEENLQRATRKPALEFPKDLEKLPLVFLSQEALLKVIHTLLTTLLHENPTDQSALLFSKGLFGAHLRLFRHWRRRKSDATHLSISSGKYWREG
jgi:hypothetical protein